MKDMTLKVVFKKKDRRMMSNYHLESLYKDAACI